MSVFGFNASIFYWEHSFPVSTSIWSASRRGNPQINRQVTDLDLPENDVVVVHALVTTLFSCPVPLVDIRARVHLVGGYGWMDGWEGGDLEDERVDDMFHCPFETDGLSSRMVR